MGNIFSSFEIPSAIIDDDLLKEISKIIEKEKDEREIKHKKLLLEKRKELENEGYNSEDAKDLASRLVSRPYITLYYKLKSNDSRVRTYESINELLENKHVYKTALRIQMSITHYDPDYLSIDILLNNERKYEHGSCEITSSDEGKLHKVEMDLKGKFESKKTEYSWIYGNSFKNKVRILIAFTIIIVYPIIVSRMAFKPEYQYIGLIIVILFMPFLWFLLDGLWEFFILPKLKSIHPYFYFKLGNNPKKPSDLFKYINKIIIGVIVALIVAAIISIFSYFKQFLFGG